VRERERGMGPQKALNGPVGLAVNSERGLSIGLEDKGTKIIGRDMVSKNSEAF
jgi:hypothetical protein